MRAPALKLTLVAAAVAAACLTQSAAFHRATARIIFVTDLVSDKSNPADAEGDDAEFMSIVRAHAPCAAHALPLRVC